MQSTPIDFVSREQTTQNIHPVLSNNQSPIDESEILHMSVNAIFIRTQVLRVTFTWC